ncbi:lactosylceramide 4-alpha-galactosyltransferase isoform X1 [Varanus komodoensis]|nr:lactosylceramide 4-alpha-galactosyltransferase isoform X1 [Varanus komodoensis]XP_044306799.1 lactosylceramide 4-alpha-galactosyltransferase isoform X1 [Varanus komodoensis]XP_044306800.1 lactosylceramide 4-alpha-galactosyltransferase isoform X1 [Varanus komodoensis]XP_044306801.1 lactosylceramide 4-alpha-galactosyltransferase isoform X1 [Varanus komodoensis]XP_044306802.1 lactosylceramide 4-alpha-galactosyltransferase isoform X1 [Varanus komodoensis]XP_044306803.1 lactosylceramide 4-alpha-
MDKQNNQHKAHSDFPKSSAFCSEQMMCEVPACVLKLNKVVSNHKLWAVFIITFKFMSFISIMYYWRITQYVNDKRQHYSLPVEVKCPPSPPTLISGWSSTLPKDIYFLETSERTNPNFLFMCSVESAARIHPESRIVVLMKGLAKYNNTLPKHLGISLLNCFRNLEFKKLDLINLFSDTPLADWYSQAQQRWEPYFLPILSDACRIAIMWKFGGIYLDTDFIILKNLNNLTNTLGMQSKYVLNGAFLSFVPKHNFIELCMQDFVANYNRWIWGHQGPQLFTRIFKKWCSIHSLQSSKSCRGVTVLPQEAFYPIRWQDWKKYFEAVEASELPKHFKNTYAVHVWNKKSQGTQFEVTSKALLAQLHYRYCPSTYSLMKIYQI